MCVTIATLPSSPPSIDRRGPHRSSVLVTIYSSYLLLARVRPSDGRDVITKRQGRDIGKEAGRHRAEPPRAESCQDDVRFRFRTRTVRFGPFPCGCFIGAGTYLDPHAQKRWQSVRNKWRWQLRVFCMPARSRGVWRHRRRHCNWRLPPWPFRIRHGGIRDVLWCKPEILR